MLKNIYKKFSNDIGIDLGTANTLVYVKGFGVVINEPSIVALNQKTNQIVAIGKDAKAMWGKTPEHIKIVRPLLDGVVSDFEVTEEMLSYFIRKAESYSKKFFRPRIVIGVPSGITNVEMRAVYDATINAGAREVYLVEEAMASAIGVRLPVLTSTVSFVVDIGGGTTDIALLSLGGSICTETLRVAGDAHNKAILEYIKDECKLLIGEHTAEQLKIELGAAEPSDFQETEIRGRDILTGLPKAFMVTNSDIYQALQPSLILLYESIKEVLEKAPPETHADILSHGIILTGGGALLPRLEHAIAGAVGVPCFKAEEPLSAGIRGIGIFLEEFEQYKKISINLDDYVRSTP